MKCGLVVFAMLAACSSGPYVRVSVDGIPQSAVALSVVSVLAGHTGDEEHFDLPNTSAQTFALHLPDSNLGWLALGIAARDTSGCDLAWNAPGIDLTGQSSVLDLDVILIAVNPPTCGLGRSAGMMYVPAQTVTLGCDTMTDSLCASDETPARPIALGAYEIDRTEVTVADYADCMRAGICPTTISSADYPGDGGRDWVDWQAASTFCTSRGKTLPTEAQFEGAARGTDARIYPWGNDAPTCMLANFGNIDPSQSCAAAIALDIYRVGLLPAGASPFGVLDLAGNLEEWTADWYAPRSSLTADEYVTGPAGGTDHVIKGGSLFETAIDQRSSSRLSASPDGSAPGSDLTTVQNTFDRGFRCVRAH